MNETPRDRIATPAEMAALLAALDPDDALPYALAVYAMGRRAQIQRLRWRDIDLDAAALEWGTEDEARKSAAAQRVVPILKPLLAPAASSHVAAVWRHSCSPIGGQTSRSPAGRSRRANDCSSSGRRVGAPAGGAHGAGGAGGAASRRRRATPCALIP
jgi:integrase